MPKHATLPGYAAGLPLVARRSCGLWGRGTSFGVMSDHDEPHPGDRPVPRTLICGHCGEPFTCSLGGDCWCDAEPARLPLPATGDCLCRNCMRRLALR